VPYLIASCATITALPFPVRTATSVARSASRPGLTRGARSTTEEDGRAAADPLAGLGGTPAEVSKPITRCLGRHCRDGVIIVMDQAEIVLKGGSWWSDAFR
jgi:hypothetical protein